MRASYATGPGDQGSRTLAYSQGRVGKAKRFQDLQLELLIKVACLGHGELIGHCAAGARRYSGDEDGVDGVLRLKRTGSLFQKPFKRKRIDSDRYLVTLVVYIH